jgi:putative sigma-54 modulation protein
MLALSFVVVLALLSTTIVNAWVQKPLKYRLSKTLPSSQLQTGRLSLHMVSSLSNNLDIFSKDFDLTPTLRERVEKKIGKVINKLSVGGLVRSTHVVLRVLKFPANEHHSSISKKDSQIVEVTVRMKGGVVINASEKTEDMYASIDLVSHKLAQMLKKHNQKIKEHKNTPGHEAMSSILYPKDQAIATYEVGDSFDESELLEGLDKKYTEYAVQQRVPKDALVPTIRSKSFPMPPISVADAIVALQFVDHPFYVFRNKDTNEINVVYKRESGGVGHIMPEKSS